MKKKLWLFTIAIVLLAALQYGCKKDDFVPIESECPAVLSTDPENHATSVPLNQVISVFFNEPMNSATINASSFYIQSDKKSAAQNSAGTITYDEQTNTAKLTPSAPLAPNTTYIARITEAIKDKMGNSIQEDYVWTFSTSDELSTMVVATDPRNTSKCAPLSTVVTVTFNLPMDPLSLTASTFTLYHGTTPVSGTVSSDGATASFVPTDNLLPNTIYRGTVKPEVESATGDAMGYEYSWTFTTGCSEFSSVIYKTDAENADIDVAHNKSDPGIIVDLNSHRGILLSIGKLAIGAYSHVDGRMLAQYESITMIRANTINRL